MTLQDAMRGGQTAIRTLRHPGVHPEFRGFSCGRVPPCSAFEYRSINALPAANRGQTTWHGGCSQVAVARTVSEEGLLRLNPIWHETVAAHMIRTKRRTMRSIPRVAIGTVVILLSLSRDAHASFMSPETEDALATFLAMFILFIVPVVLIVLFWMVHILPEKIAHKRHHPQFEAIRTLCLLSLVFGGLLWPLAWLWAYSKPVMYKMAYGTDKHDDAIAAGSHSPELAIAATTGTSLGGRLARLEQRGVAGSELTALRADLEALEAKYEVHEAL